MFTRVQLRAKARRIRSGMRQIGQMMQGTVMFRNLTCGTPTCRCHRGQIHSCVCVNYKENGKSKTVYIAKEMQAEALVWAANYRRHKKLLKELTQTNLQLLRIR